MINIPLDQITKEDIETLVENEVPEGKNIEYKEQLPGGSDGDKKEFLADVSSFANAGGGHLIYGIKEKRDDKNQATGIPESVEGLGDINPDNEISRLENIIRTGIEPRVPGVHSKFIDGFSDNSIIIIHIPKSWAGPHMVTYQNTSRFFSRTSNGKYQLDTQEIRTAFTLSEEIGRKAQEFRHTRLGLILADETPISLAYKTKVVLHLLPINFTSLPNQIDISSCEQQIRSKNPIYSYGGKFRFNFDGALHHDVTADSKTLSYLQFFRSGVIESVSSYLIHPHDDSRLLIPSIAFEEKMIAALNDYLALYKELGLEPPLIAFLSLLFVKGYSMAAGPSFNDLSTPIDRDHLIHSDLLIEDFNQDASIILRPWFDNVWQACGWNRSISYDQDGKFVSRI